MPPAAVLMLSVFVLAACAGRGAPAPAPAAGESAHWDGMSRAHAGHTPAANAGAHPPRKEVAVRDVEYVVNGRRVKGYEARPAGVAEDAPLPAVIVVHEWWGLNENIRMMTRRLAGEGFRALALDMYHGRVAETPEEARALVDVVAADPDRGLGHLRSAAAYLRQQAGAARIGVIGWCFGGGWALQGALELPERIDAAVMYYGRLELERRRLALLETPLLGLFGAEDQGIPVDLVRQMDSILRQLSKDATILVYPGAGHGFANPSGEAYQPEPADDAWRRTIAFFDRHLRQPGPATGD
ncbi:MAG TPA: dienelactone hydrolase family protein [Longimicrobium sp.]|nr:dienelactone hydrolase family protein [Longimicrobium sp.]